MERKIKKHIEEALKLELRTLDAIKEFKSRFLGRKGILQELFEEFKSVPAQERANIGKSLNEFKQLLAEKIEKSEYEITKILSNYSKSIDLTLDGYTIAPGARHPVSIIKNQIIDIFTKIGFTLSEGPEIVDDWHNFSALNFPKDHPARDMQDTFFLQLDPDYLLRTHTSSVQIQVMSSEPPPIRTISIGRVYRNETITYKSHIQFHQIEGLYIDKSVSFADLKQTLYYFVHQMFGDEFKIRLRPSFFPFTEPSAEMDICPKKGETKWMEILGCGMVHTKVLENCGIDSKKYSGYAFGIGIERMALLKFKINDIRVLYQNDLRFLKQFVTAT